MEGSALASTMKQQCRCPADTYGSCERFYSIRDIILSRMGVNATGLVPRLQNYPIVECRIIPLLH